MAVFLVNMGRSVTKTAQKTVKNVNSLVCHVQKAILVTNVTYHVLSTVVMDVTELVEYVTMDVKQDSLVTDVMKHVLKTAETKSVTKAMLIVLMVVIMVGMVTPVICLVHYIVWITVVTRLMDSVYPVKKVFMDQGTVT